jgi:hypothetical protein
MGTLDSVGIARKQLGQETPRNSKKISGFFTVPIYVGMNHDKSDRLVDL